MRITALRSLQAITLLMTVILAWLYYTMWKDFIFTLAILSVAVIYLVLQIRMPSSLDPEEKKRAILRLNLLLWMLIVNLSLDDTPYEKMRYYFSFILIVFIILLDWKEILGFMSRVFRFVRLIVEWR